METIVYCLFTRLVSNHRDYLKYKGSLSTRKSMCIWQWYSEHTYIDWCHSVPGSKLELLHFLFAPRCQILEALCRKGQDGSFVRTHRLELYVLFKEEDSISRKGFQKIGKSWKISCSNSPFTICILKINFLRERKKERNCDIKIWNP